MGCDIHTYAESRNPDGTYVLVPGLCPFLGRSYGKFAFLAGVRNYSAVQPISEPRGLPKDLSPEVIEHYEDWKLDAHTMGWLSVSELVNFDYDQETEDRRYTAEVRPGFYDGRATAPEGQGERMSWRTFLGPEFFRELNDLEMSGVARVVFWFDN